MGRKGKSTIKWKGRSKDGALSLRHSVGCNNSELAAEKMLQETKLVVRLTCFSLYAAVRTRSGNDKKAEIQVTTLVMAHN